MSSHLDRQWVEFRRMQLPGTHAATVIVPLIVSCPRRDYQRDTVARPIIFPQRWVHGFRNKGNARSVLVFTRMTLAHRVQRRPRPNAIAIPAGLSDDPPRPPSWIGLGAVRLRHGAPHQSRAGAGLG